MQMPLLIIQQNICKWRLMPKTRGGGDGQEGSERKRRFLGTLLFHLASDLFSALLYSALRWGSWSLRTACPRCNCSLDSNWSSKLKVIQGTRRRSENLGWKSPQDTSPLLSPCFSCTFDSSCIPTTHARHPHSHLSISVNFDDNFFFPPFSRSKGSILSPVTNLWVPHHPFFIPILLLKRVGMPSLELT